MQTEMGTNVAPPMESFAPEAQNFAACEWRRIRKKGPFLSPFLGPFFVPTFGSPKVKISFRGPKMETKKGAKNGDKNGPFFPQVITYFSWINCAFDAAAAAKKEPLVVNCDETAIAFSYTGRKGNVIKSEGNEHAAFERARLGDKRGTITYLAFISGTPGVQRVLPQILLGNTYRFPVAALRALSTETPHNIHLWRHRSAWMDHQKFKRALKLLNEALTPREHQQLILVLDCTRFHLRANSGMCWPLEHLDSWCC